LPASIQLRTVRWLTFRVWAISQLLGQARHPQNAIARDRRRSNVHTWIQVPRASFGATVNVAWDSEQRLPQRRSACLLLGRKAAEQGRWTALQSFEVRALARIARAPDALLPGRGCMAFTRQALRKPRTLAATT
jgi:hypothetical protein